MKQCKTRDHMIDKETEYLELGVFSEKHQLILDKSKEVQVLIIGGGSGGGKSYMSSLLSVPIVARPNTRSVFIRKTTPQLEGPGGLIETAKSIYGIVEDKLPGRFTKKPNTAHFNNGSIIDFKSLRSDMYLDSFRGYKYDYISIDEATHHTQHSLETLVDRLHKSTNNSSHMVLTCTARNGHYLHNMIKGYYLDEEGYPIDERAGDIRYFYRHEGEYYWGDSRVGLANKLDVPEDWITSFSYVGLTIFDNPCLVKNNPGYLDFLLSLDDDSKSRLLYGRW